MDLQIGGQEDIHDGAKEPEGVGIGANNIVPEVVDMQVGQQLEVHGDLNVDNAGREAHMDGENEPEGSGIGANDIVPELVDMQVDDNEPHGHSNDDVQPVTKRIKQPNMEKRMDGIHMVYQRTDAKNIGRCRLRGCSRYTTFACTGCEMRLCPYIAESEYVDAEAVDCPTDRKKFLEDIGKSKWSCFVLFHNMCKPTALKVRK
jgi:hypothetical protein